MRRSQTQLIWISFFVQVLCMLTLLWVFQAQASSKIVSLHTFGTHSRLSISVDEGFSTEWKTTSKGFELLLKGLTLTDLGAPLGSEKEWVLVQSNLEDGRLQKLDLFETSKGVTISGKWKFPQGESAPARPEMELFHFRQKEPAKIVIDFWIKEGLTVAQARERSKKEKIIQAKKQSQLLSEKRRARYLASEKLHQEMEDIAAFCKMPLSDERDIVLAFAPAKEPFPFEDWVATQKPDANYNYLEPKTETEEAQHVKLAFKLYREGQSALALRTIDFFNTTYSKSSFRAEMKFLQANAFIQLGMQSEAEQILKELTVDDRYSPAAIHSAMYLGVRKFRNQAYLQALETFLWLTSNHSNHRLNWLFRLGAAESLAVLKQTDRAAKEYQWVFENAPDNYLKAQGGFRLGDLYLDRLQYDQALASYFMSVEKFPEEAIKNPTIKLNRAESLYWLGQYDRSQSILEDFLEKHPGHPLGWRAFFRLGEIYSRKQDESSRQKGRENWLATVNHYPFSPGATLARLKLLPCDDHAGFTFKTARKFLNEEAKNFDGAGEIIMDRYRDYRAVALVRTLIALGQNQEAVSEAIHEIHRNAGSMAKRIAGGMLEALFRRSIIDLLDQEKELDALSFYQEQTAAIVSASKDSPYPTQPDYILKLSRAAANQGLGFLAQRLMEDYKGNIETAKRTGRIIIGGVVELQTNPKALADIEDRLKQSETAFTKAKAIWISEGLSKKNEIYSLLEKVSSESEFSYEKEILLGLIAEKESQVALALEHALKAQLLYPERTTEASKVELYRLKYWIAQLHYKNNHMGSSVKIISHLSTELQATELEATELQKGFSDKNRKPASFKTLSSQKSLAATLGVAPIPPIPDLHLFEGDLYSSEKKWDAAAQAYQKAIEAKSPGNRAAYEYARALKKIGDTESVKKSSEVLKKIVESSENDFWKRLAMESLTENQGG